MENKVNTNGAGNGSLYTTADNVAVRPAQNVPAAQTAPTYTAPAQAAPTYAAASYTNAATQVTRNSSDARYIAELESYHAAVAAEVREDEALSPEQLKAKKKAKLKSFRIDVLLAGLMMIVFTLIINFLSGYANQLVMYAAIPDVVSEVWREGGPAALEGFYYNTYCAEGSPYYALSGITDNIGYCFFVLLYFIAFAVFALCRGMRGEVLGRGQRFSAKFLLSATAIGMGLVYVWAYIYTIAEMFVDVIDLGYIFEMFEASSNAALATPLGAIFYVISTCIFAPLGEEFVCRGVILGTLKKHGNWWAILMSAMLFALIHMNFYQGPYAFLMGIVLGYVAVKTGSIWCPVIIHMINNTWSVIGELVYEYAPDFAGVFSTLQTLVMLGLMGAAVVLPIVYATKGQIKLPQVVESSKTKVRAKTLRFCLSPLNLIFIAFCLLTAVLLVIPQ